MGEFVVKFRGVRGSYPIANKNFLKYGGNTSCVEITAGCHKIIIDAGTGIINCGNDLVRDYITSSVNPEDRKPIEVSVLLSHIHQDHLQGLTFFNPLHVKSAKIHIFGSLNENENLEKELDKILFGKTFPLELKDIAGTLDIKNINPEQYIILKENGEIELSKTKPENQNDVIIEHYKSYSHPKDGVVIYKISYNGKSLVYASDKESYLGGDKKLIQFAKNCDLLIHDAQYTTEDYLNPASCKQGFGHSTFDMAIEIQKKTNAEKLVFFHYEPTYDDNKLDLIKTHYENEFGNKVIMAQENMIIDLIKKIVKE